MFKSLSKKITNTFNKGAKEKEPVVNEDNFTLDDFAKQMGMMSKVASFQKLAKFVPGMGAVSPEMLQKGKVEMERFKVILVAMTKEERLNPSLLDNSRKSEIAKDAGVTVQDINQLLQKFEQSKQFVKIFKKSGKLG